MTATIGTVPCKKFQGFVESRGVFQLAGQEMSERSEYERVRGGDLWMQGDGLDGASSWIVQLRRLSSTGYI